MNAFFIPGLLEMWVACGSKYGKTYAASGAISLAFPLYEQCLWRWVAPIYTQSKIGFKYCKRMLPPEPYVKANESALSLNMKHVDSQIQFFHGQHAESLEGEATRGTVLDEAAKMVEDVYTSSKTTTTVTRGPMLIISTPRGKNWFYKKCMEAKQEMLRARAEGRRPTKIFIHAPTSSNPAADPAIIQDARRSMPLRLYRQYYEADFVSDGSVFDNVGSCFSTDFIEFDTQDQFTWYHPEAKKLNVVIGVDWARNVDYTIFTAWCPDRREMVGIWRMRKQPYPSQINRLKTFAASFNDCMTVWHDKTGVGVALDDMLAQSELPYRGFTFTNASKNEFMVKLMVSFEQASIKIPQIDHIIDELNDIEVTASLTGLPRYAAIEGSTDDIVMSMGLGHAAMLEYCDRDFSIIEF